MKYSIISNQSTLAISILINVLYFQTYTNAIPESWWLSVYSYTPMPFTGNQRRLETQILTPAGMNTLSNNCRMNYNISAAYKGGLYTAAATAELLWNQQPSSSLSPHVSITMYQTSYIFPVSRPAPALTPRRIQIVSLADSCHPLQN